MKWFQKRKQKEMGATPASSATASEKAQLLKLSGNKLFASGEFQAAADKYSQAISLDPSQSTFYSNRALCYSKLEDWVHCQQDSTKALSIDPLHVKAKYLQGRSLKHLYRYDEAVDCLQKALTNARITNKPKSLCEEILLELRRTKKQHWFAHQHTNIQHHEANKKLLAQVLDKVDTFGDNNNSASIDSFLTMESESKERLMLHVVQMASLQEQSFLIHSVPDYFLCPISMEIMMDPVCTPMGVSYERHCIEAHLARNGHNDPLTRQELSPAMLQPNKCLRDAIQDYLDKNPWAFEQDMD